MRILRAVRYVSSCTVDHKLNQRVKKVESNSLWLVEFAVGILDCSSLSEIRKVSQEINIMGLVRMTFGLVYYSFSLTAGQVRELVFMHQTRVRSGKQ